MIDRRRRLLAVLATLTLLVAACGDGKEEGAAAPATDETAETDQEAGHHDDDDGGDDHGGDDHGTGHSHDHGGHSEPIEVPEGMAVPQIALTATEDPVSGHHLSIELTDFRISPESASTEPVDGEGHLHLYVDGERVMRFYNTDLHLSGLAEGEHTVMVEVSANSHAAYAVDGEPIVAMETITVGASPAHSHGADPVEVEGFPAPEATVTVVKDPKSGWNLSVDLANFEITPAASGLDRVDGEGHLHLSIDGDRQTRLYGTDWHIPSLTEGRHEVAVEFSHNDHVPYGIDGEPLRAVTIVEVSAEDASDGAMGGGMEMADEASADIVIPITLSGGEVTIGGADASTRVEVPLGSVVALQVTSDVADEVHLHGYDFFADVAPGEIGMLVFEASIPGLFEAELEGSGTLLAEIQVS